jgi:hypothetical protein
MKGGAFSQEVWSPGYRELPQALIEKETRMEFY